VPRPEEEFTQDILNNRKQITDRIYNYKKSSGPKRGYFLRHDIASVIELNKELGSQNRVEFIDTDEPPTKITNHCIKIQIDRLGHIQLADQ